MSAEGTICETVDDRISSQSTDDKYHPQVAQDVQRHGHSGQTSGSNRPRSARTDENTDQVNDMVLSQKDQPELTAQSVKYHERQAFL